MRVARFVLIAQAVIMIGFSLAYWLRPYEMANLNGMLLMETASVSHMRVYYGGLQLGLAVFLLWSAREPERARPGLVMLMLTMVALVLGRLVSLWVDGGDLVGFDLASLVYRVLAAALAAIAWYMVREQPAQEPTRIEPATRQWVSESPAPFKRGDSASLSEPATEPAVVDDAPQPFRRGEPQG